MERQLTQENIFDTFPKPPMTRIKTDGGFWVRVKSQKPADIKTHR